MICTRVLSISFCVSVVLGFSLIGTGSAQSPAGDKLRLPDGFKAEKLYDVPGEQGSWVSITHDPQGRLITSDQYGGLYRITPRESGAEVEKIPLNIGFAQGLLCAFDSLYVVSHGVPKWARPADAKNENKPSGLYRLKDTDGDDEYDSVELLREIKGGSEHGPHAVILSPDKKSLFICSGNHTAIPDPEVSRVPKVWQEDQVLRRFPDAGGHAVGKMAPGGWVCKTDPDGKQFELVSVGFRNQYDIAFDPNGELFTYDADMEWDVGLPWYRPTRVCHVVSGSEFGWRHGSGKWPDYYPDSLPAVHDIGPGSPTGITFGTGAKFPAKFQNALFISDWSYGIIYSVHMEPSGSSYKATHERFCSAPALPVTDLVINPVDQAMYFLIGGRKSQSALYRVTYDGSESTAAASYQPLDPAVGVRRKLETMHIDPAQFEMEFVWSKLGDPDRHIRFAARTALEHQPLDTWMYPAVGENDPQKSLEAITAVARKGTEANQAAAISALRKIDWDSLSESQKFHLVRAYGLVICRLGKQSTIQVEVTRKNGKKIKSTEMISEVTVETKKAISDHLEAKFPTGSDFLDRELGKLLIAVESAPATSKAVKLLTSPSAPDPQIAYAMMLSDAKAGWDLKTREQYFQWFVDAQNARGGNSFGGYIDNVRTQAISRLSESDKSALAEVLNRQAESTDPYAELKARPFVKNWKLDDLLPLEDSDFTGRDLANGKKMFALGSCYKCHRISGQGGIVGPDLTPAGHRFSTKDLLETMIDPNKEISDQYVATVFQMEDGKTITGRVANLNEKTYWIQQDMIDPGNFLRINVAEIEAMRPSKVSMMPAGLLDNMTKDEILDLMAYLKSTATQD